MTGSAIPVVAVTGGTLGIGRHAVDVLAADGVCIGVCARRNAAAVAAVVTASHGVPAVGIDADVTDTEALDRFANAIVRELGTPTGLLCCAGVLGPVGTIDETDSEAWASAVAVNLVGVANTIRAFVPHMAAGASIVTMAGGGIGGPNVAGRISAYTASKAAVASLTETLGGELEQRGIRVNAIAPGAIATQFTDPLLEAGPARAGSDLYEATRRQRSNPDELQPFADLLRFLLSDESVAINGRTVSARWENPAVLAETVDDIRSSSRYQLRRIDEALYGEIGSGN